MIDRAISVIAPHYCYGCGLLGGVLCLCCKNDILDEPFSGCVVCGAPTHSGSICSVHNLPYGQLWCVSRREGALARVIDAYKFQNVRSAYKVLAGLLSESLPSLPNETMIVPIPTAPRNIRIRGYDHTVLLGRELARLRGWGLVSPLRRRSNITQHFAKSADERRKQAREFFEAPRSIEPTASYLIIDDIFTTGSTIQAATDCLVGAGAESVSVAVLARQ